MALVNCKNCGRLYNQTHRDLCSVCVREEDEKFIIVRDYLKEHRGASTYEVSEATEIETTLIVKFIREGRLAALNNPNLNFPCEACETPITEGRFCRSCKDRLQRDLSLTQQELSHSRQSEQAVRRDYFHKRER